MTRNLGISLAILAAIMSMSAAQAQDTLVVSPRVGKVIDAQECRYFQLFPTQPQQGDIVLTLDGQGQAVVKNDAKRLGFLNSEQLQLLRLYISEYDSLRMKDRRRSISRAVNDRFELLWDTGVIAPFGHWEGETVQVIVQSGNADPKSVKGELIWADRDQLYVLPEGEGESASPVRLLAKDLVSISTFSANPGKGALLGGGIGAGLGLLFGVYITSTSPGYRSDESTILTAILTVVGAISFSVVGTIIGIVSYSEDRIDIESSYYYDAFLPELQKIMYYRYGLPPDSP